MVNPKKVDKKIGIFIWDPAETLDSYIDIQEIVAKLSKMKIVVRCESIKDPFAEEFTTSLKGDLQNDNINIRSLQS